MDIEFPGCLVRIAVPDDWSGEWEDENGIVFRRKSAVHRGDLRLITSVFTSNRVTEGDLAGIVIGLARKTEPSMDGTNYRLAWGAIAACGKETRLEDGVPISSMVWYAAISDGSSKVLIVTFDYTVSLADTRYPEVEREIDLFTQLVNSSDYYFAAEE